MLPAVALSSLSNFVTSKVLLKGLSLAFKFLLFSVFSTIIFAFTMAIMQEVLSFLEGSAPEIFGILVYFGIINYMLVTVAIMVQAGIVLTFISFFKSTDV